MSAKKAISVRKGGQPPTRNLFGRRPEKDPGFFYSHKASAEAEFIESLRLAFAEVLQLPLEHHLQRLELHAQEARNHGDLIEDVHQRTEGLFRHIEAVRHAIKRGDAKRAAEAALHASEVYFHLYTDVNFSPAYFEKDNRKKKQKKQVTDQAIVAATSGHPTQVEAADRLGIVPRQLRRRLAAMETSGRARASAKLR